jgi:signal transduction histidine kinase
MFEPDDATSFDADTACPSCSATTLTMETRKFPPDDADALTAHLRSIIGSGEHLLAVVNDILDYSKLAAGKMQLTLERVDVADAVARALDTVAPGARTSGVQLRSHIETGLAVDADATRLVQILINLAQNAVKFSSSGGVVEVNAAVDGDVARIDVVDHGIGIAPEHHAAIFESFRQIEGGHTRKRGGTGLGLAIVKQMVEMHGGAISVDSALGKGAKFTVKLKRASTSA